MADKRLFPGAVNQKVREERLQERIDAYNREQQEKKEKQIQDNEKENHRALIDFFMYRMGAEFDKKKAAKILGWLVAINAFGMGSAAIIADTHDDKPRFSDNIKEMYVPHFHGAVVRDGVYVPSFTNNEINNKWPAHMIVLGAEALLLAIILGKKINKRAKIRRDVNAMLDVKQFGFGSMNDKLLSVAPEIVRHMSGQSRVYFDMIMNKDLDYEDNSKVFEFAKNILEGHLQSHPEDAELVLSTFDVQSLPAFIRPTQNFR